MVDKHKKRGMINLSKDNLIIKLIDKIIKGAKRFSINITE